MPEISRFYGIIIKMFFNEHLPPHFHAEYSGEKAQIRIKDFGVEAGHLPPKALALVVEWAAMHREELLENWQTMLLQTNATFKKIEPLR